MQIMHSLSEPKTSSPEIALNNCNPQKILLTNFFKSSKLSLLQSFSHQNLHQKQLASNHKILEKLLSRSGVWLRERRQTRGLGNQRIIFCGARFWKSNWFKGRDNSIPSFEFRARCEQVSLEFWQSKLRLRCASVLPQPGLLSSIIMAWGRGQQSSRRTVVQRTSERTNSKRVADPELGEHKLRAQVASERAVSLNRCSPWAYMPSFTVCLREPGFFFATKTTMMIGINLGIFIVVVVEVAFNVTWTSSSWGH